MLTNSDLVELTQFRRYLHQHPEVSGKEFETAKTIAAKLQELNHTRILTGLGGHGVACEFDSGKPGPTVLFRAELDALPIQEISKNAWRSKTPGKGHLCGHDGHMTILLALGLLLSRKPIATGRVILMFQPSEEDGKGARAVISDPAYQSIKPDWAFAIHNEPGRPFGYVSTRSGLINCASLGLAIKLRGKTAHAATPNDGISPAPVIAGLISALNELNAGDKLDENFQSVTITHANMGEPTFGIAPGDGTVFATLRTTNDENLQALLQKAQSIADELAALNGVSVEFEVCDHFAATINDPEATKVATDAMDALNIPNGDLGLPMPASEDFGVFGWGAKSAMLCLGPGVDFAGLHNPDYDFPDDLIPIGASIFQRIAFDLLGAHQDACPET